MAKALKMGPGTWDRKPLKKARFGGFFFTEQHPGGFRWLPTKNMSFFGGGNDVECFGGWKLLDYG